MNKKEDFIMNKRQKKKAWKKFGAKKFKDIEYIVRYFIFIDPDKPIVQRKKYLVGASKPTYIVWTRVGKWLQFPLYFFKKDKRLSMIKSAERQLLPFPKYDKDDKTEKVAKAIVLAARANETGDLDMIRRCISNE
jgi:hypothetical protein